MNKLKLNHAKRVLLLLALGLLAVALLGCVEGDPDTNTDVETRESFIVTPVISISEHSTQSNVMIREVFLGVGSVILEPLDDMHEPMLSNRSATPLLFDLRHEPEQSIELPGLTLAHPGRYLLSISIEPMVSGPNQLTAALGAQSLALRGDYYKVNPNTDPVVTPEPVPWRDPNAYKFSKTPDMFEQGQISRYPFEYESARTGFIRLGEVELTADSTSIVVSISLESWLADALAPVLADFVTHPQVQGPPDLSDTLESAGLGMERFFWRSSTEVF
ncbi:MAG: hypothetical protein CO108_25725 [Deltaproteobacteria bacterium CG_4_9_14_3_um_filter_63_12]|nr:MAG: hypothetical protein CO108_25725 [Deltaproteobacteria bacterium CG_4_9_14_3_um_filter_63_12]